MVAGQRDGSARPLSTSQTSSLGSFGSDDPSFLEALASAQLTPPNACPDQDQSSKEVAEPLRPDEAATAAGGKKRKADGWMDDNNGVGDSGDRPSRPASGPATPPRPSPDRRSLSTLPLPLPPPRRSPTKTPEKGSPRPLTALGSAFSQSQVGSESSPTRPGPPFETKSPMGPPDDSEAHHGLTSVSVSLSSFADDKSAYMLDPAYRPIGFGGFREFVRNKRRKLHVQEDAINEDGGGKVSDIFKGVSVYINGYTSPSFQVLRRFIVQHGGVFQAYLDRKSLITHIVAQNLTPAKRIEFAKYKVVTPSWILDSIKKGRLESWEDHRLRTHGTGRGAGNGGLSWRDVDGAPEASTSSKTLEAIVDDAPAFAAFRQTADDSPLGHPSLQRRLDRFIGSAASGGAPLPSSPSKSTSPRGSNAEDTQRSNKATTSPSKSRMEALAMGKPSPWARMAAGRRSKPGAGNGPQTPERFAEDVPASPTSEQELGDPDIGVAGGMDVDQDHPGADRMDGQASETGPFTSQAAPSESSRPPSTLVKTSLLQSSRTASSHDAEYLPCSRTPHEPRHSASPSPEERTALPRLPGTPGNRPHPNHPSIPYTRFSSNALAAKLVADPNWREAHTAASGDAFLKGFFEKSRLHHLSTWKAELREWIGRAQEEKRLAEERELEQTAAVGRKAGSAVPRNKERVVMHVDFDSFFVSAVLRDRPELRDKPVAVCHGSGRGAGTDSAKGKGKAMACEERDDKQERPVVVDARRAVGQPSTSEIASCNYVARTFGVKNGQSLGAALELCPSLITLPYDFPLYQKISLEFYTTLLPYADRLQAVSVDEALMEVGDRVRRFREESQSAHAPGAVPSEMQGPNKPAAEEDWPRELAEHIRSGIRNKTRCEVSIGISSNVLLARLATRRAKPAGSYHLVPGEVADFLAPLDVSDLHGVGWSTAAKVEERFGTTNVGELTRLASKDKLVQLLGPRVGETMWNALRGIDDRQVETYKSRKSVSAEVNYGIRFETVDQVERFFRGLAAEVSSRLRAVSLRGRSLALKIMARHPDAPIEAPKFMGHGWCEIHNRSTSLARRGVASGGAVDDADTIFETAWAVMQELRLDPKELRGIGIQVQKLEGHAGKERVVLEKGQRRLPFGRKEDMAEASARDRPGGDVLTPAMERSPSGDGPSGTDDEFAPAERPSFNPPTVIAPTLPLNRGDDNPSEDPTSRPATMPLRAMVPDGLAQMASGGEGDEEGGDDAKEKDDGAEPKLKEDVRRASTEELSKGYPNALTQIVVPTQLDESVLVAMPPEILEQIEAAKASKVAKAAAPMTPKRRAKQVMQDEGDRDDDSETELGVATLPDFSEVDPEVLEALPSSVREELKAAYAVGDRPNNSRRSPTKLAKEGKEEGGRKVPLPKKWSPPKKNIGGRRRGGGGGGGKALGSSPLKERGLQKFDQLQILLMDPGRIADSELLELEIDPEFFAGIPAEDQRNVLRQQWQKRQSDLRRRKEGCKLEAMGWAEQRRREAEHKARHSGALEGQTSACGAGAAVAYGPAARRGGTSGSILVNGVGVAVPALHRRSSANEIRELVSTWFATCVAEGLAPEPEDVERVAAFVLDSLDVDRRTGRLGQARVAVEKVAAVLAWWRHVLRKRWSRRGDAEAVVPDVPDDEARLRERWWSAFECVKARADEAMRARFGAPLSLD